MEENDAIHDAHCDGMGDAMDDGYDVAGCLSDDVSALEDDDPNTTASDACLACIEVSQAELAAKGLRDCTPEPDVTACADDLDSPECRACVSKRITDDIRDGVVPGGSTLCTYGPGVDADGDEYWLGDETSFEECVHLILAMFPDPADREEMAMTWEYDCDIADFFGEECHDDCYVELGVNTEDWHSEAASYASYTAGEIYGNEWHGCLFNADYNETAAIAEAEAACGYGAGDEGEAPENPEKVSGAFAATAGIGVIVNAMLTALW